MEIRATTRAGARMAAMGTAGSEDAEEGGDGVTVTVWGGWVMVIVAWAWGVDVGPPPTK
jgi:hypothetical protein